MLGIEDENLKHEFLIRYNKLPNLQLLQANLNVEKHDKHFNDWLKIMYPNPNDVQAFLMQNHIASDASLEFEDFISFYNERRKTLKAKLQKIFNLSILENNLA
jgi:Tfp pilus assembly protein PilO